MIVSADHGGLGLSHDDATVIDNYRIPFFAWGDGVPARRRPLRAEPRPGEPRPDASRRTPRPLQPIRNADSADLVTELLGFGPVPGSTINDDQSLDIS